MPATNDITGLDLDSLLEKSRPRAGFQPGWLFFVAIGVVLLMFIPGGSTWLAPVIPVLFAGLIFLALFQTSRVAKAQVRENDRLRFTDEALRLGDYQTASRRLGELLAAPLRRPQSRIQALIYLASQLNRAGRYGDVIRLCDELESQAQFPPPISLSLRCIRVYAMLRDDQLSDSYQALADLRRDFPSGSGMLSMLEMYRLVKTGHNEEALAMLGERRTQFATQLGHRSSDTWALASAAALAMGQRERAADYARRAALLGDKNEIVIRLPETAGALSLLGSKGETSA